ncbi:hypothetical protein TMFG_03881 [Mycobacterium tuberculosis SUMu006]|nr:hypothetical protein TMFG_03881 [Mycobacterium tuberculosis SUMu006]
MFAPNGNNYPSAPWGAGRAHIALDAGAATR